MWGSGLGGPQELCADAQVPRTDEEGAALVGDRGSGPDQMRRSFQSGCLATLGENRKWNRLEGVEAEGGRRLEMEGEPVGMRESQGARGAEAQAEGRGRFAFTF